MKTPVKFGAVLLAALVAACSQDSTPGDTRHTPAESTAAADFQKQLLKQLITAQPGDVIEIPEGRYELNRSLSLNVDGVTIRGAGMDKTILSFKNQIQGAEGLLVNASDFTIEDLALEDTIGDALKVNEGKNIIIRDIRVEWTNGPSTENGAYGIYPVQTENTLVEGTVAIGASDAGIYVGQSRNVIVRNNRAEFNVAGIEIENTIGADVYDNVATNNTGGILVFNMPNLPQPGHSTRVYNNKVYKNNTENFGHEGTPVAAVPAGSGVVINSNDFVEIFNNEISDNDTANIIVSSYFSAGYYSDKSTQENFDPYPEGIYIYDNTFTGGGTSPDHLELKALKVAKFGLTGRLPDVLWDGAVDSQKMVDGALPPTLKLCIENEGVGIINIDVQNDFKNISTDIAAHNCSLKKLPQVVLEFDSEQEEDKAQHAENEVADA
ncbi:right-handed parallel beta-helix repeat-containing protein [Microbulbifer salipaludis]|uniref:Right-handed parallel beta-helix repeat-containing protein n=1 Tax=Microbulbifer salipaludis TaxID=187980 RepID=A0ABS3EAU2_9GAMM|nr:parallel beta-helix domain-containing protein [Microbulbifer salipaludis]MBN8432429.1 right-handed parallel beta-helix repeat-containing protein [Microbulbifer salipaludis]